MTSEALQLETFSPTKEKFILRTFGDLRLDANKLLHTSWEGLGPTQTQFVPALVGNFVEVSMTQQKDLRNTSAAIIYSMMEKQYAQTRSLK